MKLYKDGEEYQWVKNCKFPPEITLAIYIISKDFRHQKSTNTSDDLPESEKFKVALENFQHYFKPGTCTYTFPKEQDNSAPSPYYHSITDESIIYLDWKLIYPNQKLCCYNCLSHGATSELKSTKTNFTHNKSLFPLWDKSGRPTPAVVMNYECENCGSKYKANDGKLLTLLPSHVRSIYPVLPTYATGCFHLKIDLSDDLEDNITTYANTEQVSKRMYKKLEKNTQEL